MVAAGNICCSRTSPGNNSVLAYTAAKKMLPKKCCIEGTMLQPCQRFRTVCPDIKL